jgi:hypothetical protein
MATDTNEESTGEEPDATPEGTPSNPDNLSQEELAENARQEERDRRKKHRKQAGPIVLAASVVLGANGLISLYLASLVTQEHPLPQKVMYGIGLVNLALAVAVFIRKNWPRATILAAMPLTIILTAICLTVLSTAKYLVFVLSVAEIALMFRPPILDEFDAPKE